MLIVSRCAKIGRIAYPVLHSSRVPPVVPKYSSISNSLMLTPITYNAGLIALHCTEYDDGEGSPTDLIFREKRAVSKLAGAGVRVHYRSVKV